MCLGEYVFSGNDGNIVSVVRICYKYIFCGRRYISVCYWASIAKPHLILENVSWR